MQEWIVYGMVVVGLGLLYSLYRDVREVQIRNEILEELHEQAIEQGLIELNQERGLPHD